MRESMGAADMKRFLMVLVLAGCVDAGPAPTTAEGCPIYYGVALQAKTVACQQAYYEEMAKANGGTVTKCFGGPGQVTCVSP
jgi:hypothetical protein